MADANEKFRQFLNEREGVRIIITVHSSKLCYESFVSHTLTSQPFSPFSQRGRTALYLAVDAGNIDAVSTLLEFKADPEIPDIVRLSPSILHLQTSHA